MQSLELLVKKELNCDVLVVGGGVAGIAAAICAARKGASVITAERNGCLGGTATSGLVGPFMTAMDPLGKEQVIRGFMDELICRMEKEGGAIHPTRCFGGDSYSAYRIKGHIGLTPFSSETLKSVAEEMCAECGVNILYNVLLVSAQVNENNQIERAFFATKNGIYSINAKIFIDCTGDADLAAASGVRVLSGDSNGDLQVSSLFFVVDGIDKEKLDAHMAANPDPERSAARYFEKEIVEGKKNGTFPCGRHRISTFESVDNMWRINMTQVDYPINANDPEDVTKAIIECRAQIKPIMTFLRNTVPGCENIRLLYSAEMLGIRESRRIDGEYCLTEDDFRSERSFDDAIAFVGDSIDVHTYSKSVYYSAEKPCQIPYRCLLPKQINNLLVACRCLSADPIALSAVRVMPPCFAMGEAAGTAAAICIQSGILPKAIDTDVLRSALVDQGTYLG